MLIVYLPAPGMLHSKGGRENDGVLADTNRSVHEAETEFIVKIY